MLAYRRCRACDVQYWAHPAADSVQPYCERHRSGQLLMRTVAEREARQRSAERIGQRRAIHDHGHSKDKSRRRRRNRNAAE